MTIRKRNRITLEDVARLAGVSRATASRVLRGDITVTRKRVAAVRLQARATTQRSAD